MAPLQLYLGMDVVRQTLSDMLYPYELRMFIGRQNNEFPKVQSNVHIY